MSDTVLTALISALSGLLVGAFGVIPILVNREKVKKLKKPKEDLMPHPFPCASCPYEQVIQLHDEYKAEFDFSPNSFRDNIPDFASIVFKIHPPMDVQMMKELRFELRFGSGSFSAIDLELKSSDQQKHRLWKKQIPRHVGWMPITIDLGLVDPNILISLQEICFVVTPYHFPNQDQMYGEFELKNLGFNR